MTLWTLLYGVVFKKKHRRWLQDYLVSSRHGSRVNGVSELFLRCAKCRDEKDFITDNWETNRRTTLNDMVKWAAEHLEDKHSL